MLTFFTTAKAFQGHSAIIQRNALQSWKLLDPDVDVILFGDDGGAAEVCAELGLRHEPYVKRHESGMKYLDYMFARAQEIARHDTLCYSNCDIIQLPRFRRALETVANWRHRFLIVGRRWDTNITAPIDFTAPAWSARLQELAETEGKLQNTNFIDYFVFPKGLYEKLPALVVGRSYWDHWLMWQALACGAAVVDCTRFVVAIHQNHDYGYHPAGKMGTNDDALAQQNLALCDGGKEQRSVLDATHALTRGGRVVPTPWRHPLTTAYTRFLTKQGFLDYSLALRSRLGLRRSSLRTAGQRLTGWFGR